MSGCNEAAVIGAFLSASEGGLSMAINLSSEFQLIVDFSDMSKNESQFVIWLVWSVRSSGNELSVSPSEDAGQNELSEG